MPHPALSVANTTLSLAWGHQDKITPLKLQKFIYISHGFSLALTGDPLVEEKVFAWEYGPVIPEIYQEFKRFGKRPIDESATVLYEGEPHIIPQPKDDLTKVILEGMWIIYGDKSGYQLANLTHEPDTPWDQTWDGGKGKGRVISNDLIKEYYRTMLDEIKKK